MLDETTIGNHLAYDAFGNVTSETNAAVDHLFGYTGRAFDETTGLQNNLHRWYDASVGRWMSEDPAGFVAGDTNLSRYVGNNPTMATDPSGLADGWKWNWHHLLPQEIFTDMFRSNHDLWYELNPGSAEYGWMIRAKDHFMKGGVHTQGWNKDWTDWVRVHEREGNKITKEMIDEQLKKMISAYKLDKLGFPAEFPYSSAKKARKVAQRMAMKAATEEAAKIARKAGRKAATTASGKFKALRGGAYKIPVIGFVLGVTIGAALGDDDALINNLEPLGLGATPVGVGSEIPDDYHDPWIYKEWDRYQQELNQRAGRRGMEP